MSAERARIGLTYDLRTEYLAMGYGEEETAEFDRESTVEALESALRELGHEVVRIGHVRALVAALARGETWDAVFNICEGLRGYGREAQVPALLDAYDIPCTFADPLTACVTLHKGLAKRVLRDSGVATTDFRLVGELGEVDAIDLPFPLFVKPVAEGTAKGIHPTSRADDRAALRRECDRVLSTYHQPALVEPYLGGREFTTAILGEGPGARAVATLEIVLLADKAEAHAYTYLNKEQSEERCVFPLAEEPWASRCAELALAAWRALGCRDAGRVDLRADEHGRLMVLEANPLPGMHPSHSDLPMACAAVGVSYLELVRTVIDATLRRRRR
ncbi:MAG: D-alanine--D-alanine ligase [Myxococcota bacterium]